MLLDQSKYSACLGLFVNDYVKTRVVVVVVWFCKLNVDDNGKQTAFLKQFFKSIFFKCIT